MSDYKHVVAVILGGGAGSRLFPLTQFRSKPAVPLGGKYRLIDVPVSNCINSGVTQIFVLTQYNSASLNRHISRTYRFSTFSSGFVEILAAEQRADSPQWFQGTADAVRQIIPHLRDWQVDTLLILSATIFIEWITANFSSVILRLQCRSDGFRCSEQTRRSRRIRASQNGY